MPNSKFHPHDGTWRTRFAPSPTGYLHLGHLLSCAYIFGIARNLNATIDLRLENHDRNRCSDKYMEAILEDLAWCGFQFDNQHSLGAELPPQYIQSNRSSLYEEQAHRLKQAELIYACSCSRSAQKRRGCKTIGSHLIYDNHCRAHKLSFESNTWRFLFTANGGVHQESRWSPESGDFSFLLESGDFSIRDRDGFWTYQWAVVCDDLDQGMNLVIRGFDLWPTCRRYEALWTALAPNRMLPVFVHHPLILGDNGQKISKSELAKPLRQWRQEGYKPESLFALACQAIGFGHERNEIGIEELPAFMKSTLAPGLFS